MAYFYLKFGEKEIPLPEGELILGRNQEKCAIVITSKGISRVHCAFSVQEGEVWVEDLGSKSGTKVEGHTIDRKILLSPGNMIEVGGRQLFLFKSRDISPSAPKTAEQEQKEI